jgi:YegS/Rv2252/BmrU family lipid kinase
LYYVLCNPTAGGGRALEHLKRLEAYMKEEGLEYELGVTEYHRHAVELVKGAVERGFRSIYTLGGDGTVFEAVNGLAQTGKLGEVALGFLPGGTGNDLSKSIGLPHDPVEAFQLMRAGRTETIDLWKANDFYFINVFGLGLDTDLTGWAVKTKKLLKGMPAYILALLLTLFGFRNKKIRFTVDGRELDREVLVVTASNGRFYGGGILVAPDAGVADGKLELVLINRVMKLRIPFLLSKYIAGRHILEVKECEYIQAGSIVVESRMQQPVVCETDGETELTLPVRISRADGGIRVMVAEDFDPEVK